MWLIGQPTQRDIHVSDQLDHDKNTKRRTTKKTTKKQKQKKKKKNNPVNANTESSDQPALMRKLI